MAYTIQQLEEALINADAAGDTEAATALSNEIRTMQSSGSTARQPITEAVDSTKNNYIADSARLGFTNWLMKGVQAVSDPVASMVFDLPDQSALIREGTPEAYLNWQQDNDEAWQAANEELADTFLGYSYAEPSSSLERTIGAGVNVVAGDPLMSVIGARGKLGLIVEALSSLVGSTAGVAASEEVRGLVEDMGVGETGQDVAAGIAGFIAQLTGAPISIIGNSLLKGSSNLNQAVKANEAIVQSVDEISNYIGDGKIRGLLREAITAEPNMQVKLDEIAALQRAYPDMKIVPALALADNAIIRADLEHLMRTHPDFRQRIQSNIDDVLQAVDNRRELLFGTKNLSDVENNLLGLDSNYGVRLSNITRRVAKLDETIDTTLNRVRTTKDTVDVGERVASLMTARKKQLDDLFKERYGAVLRTFKGSTLSPQAVGNIHRTVKAAEASDVFARFPFLGNRIKQVFEPVKERILRPGGRASELSSSYKAANLDQIDSLKKELNKSLSGAYSNGNTTDYRILKQIKETFKAELEADLPDFYKAYKAVDNSYYQELGIPTSKAGIEQLDHARFRDEVGSYLSKPEQAADFIAFVGDAAGVPVVRDALLTRLSKSGFNATGDFNPTGYARFIRDNKRAIDLVPGFRDTLNDVGGTVSAIGGVQDRLNIGHAASAKRQADSLFKAINNRSLDTVVTEMMNSPAKRTTYLESIRNLSPESAATAIKGVRATVVDKMLRSDNRLDYINQNKNAFDDIFSSSYLNDIKNLGKAAEIANSIDLDNVPSNLSREDVSALKQTTGNSAANIASVMRERVSSMAHRVSILASRFFQKRMTATEYAQVAEFYTNPEAVSAVAKLAKLDGAGAAKITEALSETWRFVGSYANQRLYRAYLLGTEAGMVGADTSRENRQAMQDRLLEQRDALQRAAQ